MQNDWKLTEFWGELILKQTQTGLGTARECSRPWAPGLTLRPPEGSGKPGWEAPGRRSCPRPSRHRRAGKAEGGWGAGRTSRRTRPRGAGGPKAGWEQTEAPSLPHLPAFSGNPGLLGQQRPLQEDYRFHSPRLLRMWPTGQEDGTRNCWGNFFEIKALKRAADITLGPFSVIPTLLSAMGMLMWWLYLQQPPEDS